MLGSEWIKNLLKILNTWIRNDEFSEVTSTSGWEVPGKVKIKPGNTS